VQVWDGLTTRRAFIDTDVVPCRGHFPLYCSLESPRFLRRLKSLRGLSHEEVE
jgi:hypothetical protein